MLAYSFRCAIVHTFRMHKKCISLLLNTVYMVTIVISMETVIIRHFKYVGEKGFIIWKLQKFERCNFGNLAGSTALPHFILLEWLHTMFTAAVHNYVTIACAGESGSIQLQGCDNSFELVYGFVIYSVVLMEVKMHLVLSVHSAHV